VIGWLAVNSARKLSGGQMREERRLRSKDRGNNGKGKRGGAKVGL